MNSIEHNVTSHLYNATGLGVRDCVSAWLRECRSAWMRECMSMSAWMRDCVTAWELDCVNAGVRECVSAWERDCVSAWECECMNAWLRNSVSAWLVESCNRWERPSEVPGYYADLVTSRGRFRYTQFHFLLRTNNTSGSVLSPSNRSRRQHSVPHHFVILIIISTIPEINYCKALQNTKFNFVSPTKFKRPPCRL
jgi:hypothetical protein